MQGVEYCYVTVQDAGRSAADILASELPTLLKSIRFTKSMRWQPHSEVTFSRPVRWLVALHGEQVLPFTFCGTAAGRCTRLMRSFGAPDAELAHAGAYGGVMEEAKIVVEPQARQEQIWRAVQQAAQVRTSHHAPSETL